MTRRLAWVAFAALASLAPATAGADEPAPPDERRDAYSPYERKSIDAAVEKLGVVVDPRPDGKILEGVEVVSLDVFEKRDPLPGFLTPVANWFHATTRHYVIEREVLVTPGQRWSQALVDETARNLRALPQLSLVLCVPLRERARSGAPPGDHQGRVEPPAQQRFHVRERAAPVPALATDRGEPDRVAPAGLRHLHPRSGDDLPRRPVRHPPPRREPRPRLALVLVHRQPGHGRVRGHLRLVPVRAAALLDARRVGLGREPHLEPADHPPLRGRVPHRLHQRPLHRGAERHEGRRRELPLPDRQPRRHLHRHAIVGLAPQARPHARVRRQPPRVPRLRLRQPGRAGRLRSRRAAALGRRDHAPYLASTTTTREPLRRRPRLRDPGAFTENYRRGHEAPLPRHAREHTALRSTARQLRGPLRRRGLHGAVRRRAGARLRAGQRRDRHREQPDARAGPLPRRLRRGGACASSRPRFKVGRLLSSTPACSTAPTTTSTA